MAKTSSKEEGKAVKKKTKEEKAAKKAKKEAKAEKKTKTAKKRPAEAEEGKPAKKIKKEDKAAKEKEEGAAGKEAEAPPAAATVSADSKDSVDPDLSLDNFQLSVSIKSLLVRRCSFMPKVLHTNAHFWHAMRPGAHMHAAPTNTGCMHTYPPMYLSIYPASLSSPRASCTCKQIHKVALEAPPASASNSPTTWNPLPP